MPDSDASIEGLLANRPTSYPRIDRALNADNVGSDDEPIDMVGSCRFARRPQMMLSFCKASGEADVYPYALLGRVRSLDPNRSFELFFPGIRVKVEGQRLQRLFHYVCEHRVLTISESNRSDALAADQRSVIVHNIEFIGNR